MHFSLVLINRPNGELVKAFDDVILPIYFALRRLGYETEILRHTINPQSRNILFGSANDPSLAGLTPPSDSIIMNLEQLSSENSVWNSAAYLEHLRHFHVWDYSQRNIEYLRKNNIHADFLLLGYVPEMTRLNACISADYDVLFYGLLSPRRRVVLDRLKQNGLTLYQSELLFGRERDLAIANSRLYLNIHHYQPATLEVVRLGYLWANRLCVVSELGTDTEFYPGLKDACAYSSYEDLSATVCELLHDEEKLKLQADAGFEAFSRLSLEKSLENLLGRHRVQVLGECNKKPLPKHLHVGSGRDFNDDALNIDINSTCNPDLALDISKPLPVDALYATHRFGEISLAPDSFEKITAFEVLEHVSDLVQTMTNFLSLLKSDGCLILTVPYHLSLGAWQDPTHVRAFNEKSWIYYSECAWYLGWYEYRFEIVDFSYLLSALGFKEVAKGKTHDELSRMPGMIDGMRVVMRKRSSTEAERQEFNKMFRKVYSEPVRNWELFKGDAEVGSLAEVRQQIFSSPKAWRSARLKLFGYGLRYQFYKLLSVTGFCRDKAKHWRFKRNQLRKLLF